MPLTGIGVKPGDEDKPLTAIAPKMADGLVKGVFWTWGRAINYALLRSVLDQLPGEAPDLRELLLADLAMMPRWPDVPFAEEFLKREDPEGAGLALLDTDPAAVVRELLRVHRTDEPNRWHYLAGEAALRREGTDVTPEARNTLAAALRAECCRLRLPEAAGLDELNAIATEAIERVAGERLDADRELVKARPLYWWGERSDVAEPTQSSHQLRFTRALAQVLHRKLAREDAERAARIARNPSAGIAMPHLTQLVRASRFGRSSSKLQGRTDGTFDILDDRGRRVAGFESPTLPALAGDAGTEKVMAALSSLSTARVMRWAVWSAYLQRFHVDAENPNVIALSGGIFGLAKVLGLEPSGSTREELVLALEALASIRVDTPQSEGMVFGWNETKAKGRREAMLEAVVFGPLRPDYIDDDIPRGPGRKLVPIPLPQRLPALVGRPNEHAAQANLQLLVMRHFRLKARELAERGNVELSRDEMRRLLDESGTPARLIDDVLAAYFSGEGTKPGPLQLVNVGPGVVDLHPDAFGAERASIIVAGQASKRGKESRARRRPPEE